MEIPAIILIYYLFYRKFVSISIEHFRTKLVQVLDWLLVSMPDNVCSMLMFNLRIKTEKIAIKLSEKKGNG